MAFATPRGLKGLKGLKGEWRGLPSAVLLVGSAGTFYTAEHLLVRPEIYVRVSLKPS